MTPAARYLITAALTFALAPLLQGCALKCDFKYAPGGVTVDLEADAWPAGTYTVEMLGEACDFVLPEPEDTTTNYCAAGLHISPTEDGTGLRQVIFSSPIRRRPSIW